MGVLSFIALKKARKVSGTVQLKASRRAGKFSFGKALGLPVISREINRDSLFCKSPKSFEVLEACHLNQIPFGETWGREICGHGLKHQSSTISY